ncbi:hypothetical protein [Pseudoroseicyclus tamaricis]|uniref:hypothetical protein n=1 Tax=Pseudoroseicyclus tamaricis TaxID=2705421 RepID=UPI00143300AD|nr:hypothetical protein [Pseudoroseicyclus tamaricis]
MSPGESALSPSTAAPADPASPPRAAASPSPLAGRPPSLAEVFAAHPADAAAPGFVLAHLSPGPVLWVQDRLSRRESGRMLLSGLSPGVELFQLTVSRPADVLRAMEEGLACPALSAVVGEIWGESPALSFTATKRLVMRAEGEKVPAWLIRRAARADLSAARSRWRIASLPSYTGPPDAQAPTAPTWHTGLFRARFRPPADWVVIHDAGLRFTHEAPFNEAAWPGLRGPEKEASPPEARPEPGANVVQLAVARH